MHNDTGKLQKYILIKTDEKPCYARITTAFMTQHEVSIKNRAFKMNRVDKKYILEKDWK